ncbi:hypothetical protein [Melittangium boletus]|uniref:Uncharacterized protein n=1 Tax=Melittangium boletus DSM 14713 TaxID=1294270 RepID=A0A250INH7_9BACT|nr:hypothetical protein [Melittangium boletus]ATB32828.1 hypothetical protein MEBOL_006317 [Melittangium boletus DSM 14713]
MASILHAENYYAFRQIERVIDLATATPSTTSAELSGIESALVRAHQLFIARRYQDAIGAYRLAERLIYRHLNAAAPPWGLGLVTGAALGALSAAIKPPSESLQQSAAKELDAWTRPTTPQAPAGPPVTPGAPSTPRLPRRWASWARAR